MTRGQPFWDRPPVGGLRSVVHGRSGFTSENLVLGTFAGAPQGAPMVLTDIVRRAIELDGRGADSRNKKQFHAYKVRILGGLRLLRARGVVEKLPRGVGYRLRSEAATRVAVDRAVRRLQVFSRAIELPQARRGNWAEKGWLYARHAMADVVVTAEAALEAQLGHPPEEPSEIRRHDLDARNPRVYVTIPGWSMSVPGEVQDLGESAFAQGVEAAERECCGVCGRLLPHSQQERNFHDRIVRRLEQVRAFNPVGHGHSPCSTNCSAFWELDYIRGIIAPFSREIPAWVTTLPPAPRATEPPLAARQAEIQTPTPSPEASRPRTGARRVATGGPKTRKGTSRKSLSTRPRKSR